MQGKSLVITSFVLLVVSLTALSIYWPGLEGPFLLDDRQNIVHQHVADFDVDEVVYVATHNTSGLLGRPLSALSFALSGLAHGSEPWGYKYHNLILHLLNGLLIFWLLIRLLPRLTGGLSRERILWIAGMASTVWLLHPLLVSTVLYAVQRMAQLSALFTLVSLLIYVFIREQIDRPGTRFHLLAWIAFPLALALALLSKENGALIPLYVLVIEALNFRLEADGSKGRRRLSIFLGLFVCLPLVVGAAYVVVHWGSLADYGLRDYTLMERLLTQLHVLPFYLKLIVMPRVAEMSLFHDDFVVVSQMGPVTVTLLMLLLVSLMLAFRFLKRAPVVAFGIAWFLVSHLMESTFINLELVFEHRNYLAALGPLLIVVYYLVVLLPSPGLRVVVPLLLASLLAFMTHARVTEWRSEEMIYTLAVRDHPGSYRARTGYANVLFRQGRQEAAMQELQEAASINPRDAGPLLHQVAYLCQTVDGGGGGIDRLIEEARHRAMNHPTSPYTLNALESLLHNQNSGRCPDLSLEQVERVVDAAMGQRNTQKSRKYLGYLQRLKGHVQMIRGEYIQGVENMAGAYEKTGLAVILSDLIKMQIQSGDIKGAENMLAELKRVNVRSGGVESHLVKTVEHRLQAARAAGEEGREQRQ